eukprot:641428-Lingulodinium_polyedra.AAC.1
MGSCVLEPDATAYWDEASAAMAKLERYLALGWSSRLAEDDPVKWIPREANAAADWLATWARENAQSGAWRPRVLPRTCVPWSTTRYRVWSDAGVQHGPEGSWGIGWVVAAFDTTREPAMIVAAGCDSGKGEADVPLLELRAWSQAVTLWASLVEGAWPGLPTLPGLVEPRDVSFWSDLEILTEAWRRQ